MVNLILSISRDDLSIYFVQISSLPPEVVKYFTDPNATEPPNMRLLFPFMESALPLAYGVLGVQLFHVIQSLLFFTFILLYLYFFLSNLLFLLQTVNQFYALDSFCHDSWKGQKGPNIVLHKGVD